ncbi:MAG TPA: septum formation inhibitor MinC, partial [Asticcacaulis sp.]|nr:septum formation inhibitor MinC [Asticcacaulis sp.]
MSGFLRLFERRVRGVRLIELVGLVLVFGMIFWVCLSKAREGDDIRRMNDLDQQIADEQTAVNALRIKVSQLERPERLENLATGLLDMKPVDPAHETDISG